MSELVFAKFKHTLCKILRQQVVAPGSAGILAKNEVFGKCSYRCFKSKGSDCYNEWSSALACTQFNIRQMPLRGPDVGPVITGHLLPRQSF